MAHAEPRRRAMAWRQPGAASSSVPGEPGSPSSSEEEPGVAGGVSVPTVEGESGTVVAGEGGAVVGHGDGGREGGGEHGREGGGEHGGEQGGEHGGEGGGRLLACLAAAFFSCFAFASAFSSAVRCVQ